MGNYRFRFSDMIPNAWFYKLKDMNKRRSHHPKTLNPTNIKHSSSSSLSSSSLAAKSHTSAVPEEPHLSEQRRSYYFTRDLSFQPTSPILTTPSDNLLPPEPPRKSSRRRRITMKNRPPPPRIVSPSISPSCSCLATVESCPDSSPEDMLSPSSFEHDSVLTEFGSELDPPESAGFPARPPVNARPPVKTIDGRLSCSTSSKCTTENDIVIHVVDHLPPIITKKNEPTKIQRTSDEFSERNKYGSLSVKVVKENIVTTPSPIRRFSANSSSPGVKLRTNSPRIANRRIQGRRSVLSNSTSVVSRRSVSESFAVVKSSKDPGRDFRESMMEMIVANNIRASKDLEELLACYLSLNSDEYHDLIINVFKQIWFDFIHLRLK